MRQALTVLASLAGLLASGPALAARGFTAGAPYAGLQDTPYSDAEEARAIESLRAAPGVEVKVTPLVVIDGKPQRKIEITPSPKTIAKAKRPTIHVGISSGVHRDEPEALRVADQLMLDAAAGRTGNVRYTFYRPVNASPQEDRLRLSAQGIDYNRTFTNKRRTPELRPLRDDIRQKDFDLFLDLHGGKQEGFFVIGKDADDPLVARSMRALPKWLIVSHYGQKQVPLSTPGMKSSKNSGTLRLFAQRRGALAYTVEYPRRADPRRQHQGMRRLVDSMISHRAAELGAKARARPR